MAVFMRIRERKKEKEKKNEEEEKCNQRSERLSTDSERGSCCCGYEVVRGMSMEMGRDGYRCGKNGKKKKMGKEIRGEEMGESLLVWENER